MKKLVVLSMLLSLVSVGYCASEVEAATDDIAVYRGEGDWYASYDGATGGVVAPVDTSLTGFGLSYAQPMLGDINGDGIDDVVVAQGQSGENFSWVAGHSTNDGSGNGLLSSTTTSNAAGFGTVDGSLGNMLGDITGDGIMDAITINAGFNWACAPSSTLGLATGGAVATAQWGLAGDQGIVGDFNGDGMDDIGVYRQAGGNIFINMTVGGVIGAGGYNAATLGQIGGAVTDSLLVGDINGDGCDDVVMVRQDGAGLIDYFGLINDGTGLMDYFGAGTSLTSFGLEGDIPMLADMNGDGMDDLMVYRNGSWFAAFTDAGGVLTNGVDAQGSFGGVAGDIPLVGSLQVVPEPATLAILGLGGLLIRRKRA